MYNQATKSPSNTVDDSDLVTDSCSSGHQKSYSHGSEQQWKKDMSSPTSMKGYTDSDKCCLYDSGRTDSGFLSDANLVSSECLSEEISSPSSSSSKFRYSAIQGSISPEEEKDSSSYMRLDSGVDVGLNDQFHSLSLLDNQSTSSLNNLNVSSTKTKPYTEESSPFTNINISEPATSKTSPSEPAPASIPLKEYTLQPWEIYLQQDEDGDTQLHIAIVQGFIEVVYSLIRMVPDPSCLDILNDDCQAPLHLAVLTRQARIVRRLLVAGAKVGIHDRNGNTALHLACMSGDMECFKALTEPVTVAEAESASPQYTAYRQQVPQDFETRNYDGQMCIHLAALSGNVETLRHLIWFGANINAREAKSGRTVLHYAIERGIILVLSFLLEECPIGPSGLHLDTPTYAGYTAYQMAECTDLGLARELAERGARLPAKKQVESESESDSSDDEMHHVASGNYFSNFRSNGEPINASA